MPIYEEKLISPLALRYTQELIRSTFRDGRIVEETVPEISTKPGVGDYDLILNAPFPCIEVIRYRAPSSETCTEEEKDHWFTLDNRRLYCLQKVAASLWPKKVAAVVQVMYADPGSVRKKYDSKSYGASVSIAVSTRQEAFCRWDWRRELYDRLLAGREAALAVRAVFADDARTAVDALQPAPEEESRLLSGLSPPSPSSSTSGGLVAASCDRGAAGAASLTGSALRSRTPSTADRSCCSEEAEAEGEERRAAAKADDEESEAVAEAVDEALVESAIEAITESLSDPANSGYVWVPDWSKWYQPQLGPLRSFIEGRTDLFEVTPHGRGYRAALVGGRCRRTRTQKWEDPRERDGRRERHDWGAAAATPQSQRWKPCANSGYQTHAGSSAVKASTTQKRWVAKDCR